MDTGNPKTIEERGEDDRRKQCGHTQKWHSNHLCWL